MSGPSQRYAHDIHAGNPMTHVPIDALERLLAEDVPYGDLTTEALQIGNERGRIRFAAIPVALCTASSSVSRFISRT